jgi:hypothetical protein
MLLEFILSPLDGITWVVIREAGLMERSDVERGF